MNTQIRTLVVDLGEGTYHPVAQAVAASGRLELVGETEAASDLYTVCMALTPTVAVLDFAVADDESLRVVEHALATGLTTRMVLLVPQTVEPGYIGRAVRAHAAACVTRSATADQVVSVIAAVAECDAFVASREFWTGSGCGSKSDTGGQVRLTRRERDVLELASHGE